MTGRKLQGCLTLFLFLLLHSESAAGTENNKNDENEMAQRRLPRASTPTFYEIKLVLEMTENNFTFNGESKINVTINDSTRNLTLHSKDLRLDENFTSLLANNELEHKPIKHTYENATNFLIIQFDTLLAAGNYTLNLKYAGCMSSVPEGIYNSSYTNEDGERIWLVATKLTQLHARRAFPCWDEPDLKASFNLSLKHNSNYKAVSNMPIRKEFVDSDGKKWTNFGVTPVMSTYLLAFVISDFECLHDNNDKFNVCGRRNILPYLKHSLYVSKRSLDLLGKYMDFKYNLPKMDQYAVPDATTGATENWGLIIYRESSFAYEPFINPVSGKEYVTLTVVHELVHQWIGNLVTPVSWKYSWIIEGLPTYLQYYIVDKVFPDWRQMDMLITKVIQETAFNLDNTDCYNPLESEIDNFTTIRSKFSPQVYNRGAAIFHMMSNILTEPTFKAGVVKFVKQNEFGSINSDDLWNAMQSAYNERNKKTSNLLSVKAIMTGWVEQQGYPIINVTRDYVTGKVILTQEGNLEGHRSNRWWIPINFATKSNLNFDTTSPTHWLKPSDESLVIEGIGPDDWIIVNIQQSGYYRVNYDTKNWKEVALWMNTEMYEKIPVRTRAQLINDLSYMVTSGRENYTTFLDLVSYLAREDDYQPWLPTFHAIRKLRRTMYDEQVDGELKKFVLGLMQKVLKKIGFEDRSKYDWINKYKASYDKMDSATKKFVPTEIALEKVYKLEDFLTRRFRAKFLSFACSLGDKLCKNAAVEQLRANIGNATENRISPDLVSWVKCCGAESLEEELMKSINGSDIKYVGYLGCSPNKTVLRGWIEKVLSGEVNATCKQTRMAILYLAEDESLNFDEAWKYLSGNFDVIYKYFEKQLPDQKSSTQTTNAVVSILNDYIWRTRTREQINKIKEFVEKEMVRIPSWIGNKITEQTKKIVWSEENAPILGEWLHDNSLSKARLFPDKMTPVIP